MKAKNFLQFILEMESYQIDQLGDWFDGHPFEDRNPYTYLNLSDFPEVRTQFMERLDKDKGLALLLELEEIFFHAKKVGDDWHFWFQAGWSWDTEEVTQPQIPAWLRKIPLEEIRDDAEAIEAIDILKKGQLLRVARHGELTDELIEEILEEIPASGTIPLAQNPRISADWLLKLVDRWPQLKELAQQNPNWPEDITDWALGDW